MTEEIGQNTSTGSPVVNTTTEQPKEKMVAQSEVDTIAGIAREQGIDKGRREAEMAFKAQQEMTSKVSAQQVAQGSMSEEQVRQMIMQETQKQQQEQLQMAHAQQVVSEFVSKMQGGAEKYEDFESTVAALELPKIPEIVKLANSADNTADVMYELGKNPYKVASLLTLARTAPHLAQAEMARLSGSIKKNQDVASKVVTREPLSQIKHSTAGADGGELSVKDLRKQSWMRR